MAIQAHLVELERKHKLLETELHEALLHLSTDDLEIVEYNGKGRFSMDVAAHSACGVRVETFRFYRVSGQWRVSGYDREDPDVQSCDVNFRARTYSANLLTGQVVVTTLRQGKVAAVNKRKARIDALRLEDFSFSLFADEP